MNHKDNHLDNDPLDALEKESNPAEEQNSAVTDNTVAQPKRSLRLWAVLAGLLGVGGYLFYQQKSAYPEPPDLSLSQAAETQTMPKIGNLGTVSLEARASNDTPTETEKLDSNKAVAENLTSGLSSQLAKLESLKTEISQAARQRQDIPQLSTDLQSSPAIRPLIASSPNTISMPALVEELNKSTTVSLEDNQNSRLTQLIEDMNQSLARLNQEVAVLDSRLLSLNSQQGRLSNELSTLKEDLRQMRRPSNETTAAWSQEVPPRPSQAAYLKTDVLSSHAHAANTLLYTVHAIIPGRAWLKAPDGQILTVTEGDKLGDYGKVLVIDAGSGMVLTSSGTHFQ